MLTLLYLKVDIRCTVLSVYSGYSFGLLYQAFIMSLFDYCAVTCIWCLNMSQLRIMERLHSKVTLSVSHI